MVDCDDDNDIIKAERQPVLNRHNRAMLISKLATSIPVLAYQQTGTSSWTQKQKSKNFLRRKGYDRRTKIKGMNK